MSTLPNVEPFNLRKHLPQTAADKTSDLFYILSAVYLANEDEKDVTKLSLIKALFKTAQIKAEQNILFLNTFFYVNTQGPFNNIIYKYLEELEKANLIKTEGRNIFITSKGLRVISELIDNTNNQETIDILLKLKEKIEAYENASKAISETHSQKVIDTTDRNKVKTIETLINEIKPEEQFKTVSQFKYINPFVGTRVNKVSLPQNIINSLEKELANIEEQDYEKTEDLTSLFA